jgi:hypothetical protein
MRFFLFSQVPKVIIVRGFYTCIFWARPEAANHPKNNKQKQQVAASGRAFVPTPQP